MSKKHPKVHPMTKEQMKALRVDMRFSLRDLAAVTGIPYRILQNYEGGQRAIPQEVADLLRDEHIKEWQIKNELIAAQIERLDREYPNGIKFS